MSITSITNKHKKAMGIFIKAKGQLISVLGEANKAISANEDKVLIATAENEVLERTTHAINGQITEIDKIIGE